MKTLIISILLGLTALFLNAQEVTQLKETQLFYTSYKSQVSRQGDSYVYKIPNTKSVSFAKDPIGFMNKNFDIQKFIKEVAKENYESYEVNFQSNNGSLLAHFDKYGNLLKTKGSFKNVILPADIRNDIYKNYEGWTVVDAKYLARTKGVQVANATYKVRLQNGREKHTLIIDAAQKEISVVTR